MSTAVVEPATNPAIVAEAATNKPEFDREGAKQRVAAKRAAKAAAHDAAKFTLDTQMLPVTVLKLSSTNPRSDLNDNAAELQELAASIAAHGILQPLVVRPYGPKVIVTESVGGGRWYPAYDNHTPHPNLIGTGHTTQAEAEQEAAALRGGVTRYEIIAGARRYLAAKLAKLTEVPCRMVEVSDEEARDIQVIENLQRADIHPLDEAEAYAKLYAVSESFAVVAVRVSKPVDYVRRRMQLNSLTKELKKAYREHKLIPAHAYQLCRFPAAAQKAVAKQIEGHDVSPNALRKMIVDQLTLNLADAPFKTSDATLVPEAGSCVDCPKRTGNNPALFADIKAKDTCTDRPCFQKKVDAHLVQISAAIEQDTGKPALRLGLTWRPTDKGVIGENHFREAAGLKACPHAQKGIVVEADYYGSGPKRLWKVLTVCTAEKACKVHFPHGSRDSGQTEEQRKAAESAARAAVNRKRDTNKAVWAAVQEKMPKAMGSDELRVLGRQLYHRVFGPYRIRIARDVYKLEAPGKLRNSASHFENAMQKQLEGMNPQELTRFALVCLTAENALGTPYEYGAKAGSEPDNPLYQLAKCYKVDTKKIRDGISAAAKEKAAAKRAKAGKKVATKAETIH